MRQFLIKLLIFLAIPLLVSELVSRCMFGPAYYEHWYAAQAPAICKSPQCYLFIGTSRVADAIDEQAFVKTLATRIEHPAPAFNLGLGYSSLAEAYLGLRRISEHRPRGLSGCTVLIEAPFGMPSWSTWDDDWIVPPAPSLLVEYIEAQDLGQFLLHSQTNLGDKIFVVAAKLSKFPEVCVRLRDKAVSLIDALRLPASLVPRYADVSAPAADLATRGGIRTDAHGVELVRQFIRKEALMALVDQRPITEATWNSSVLKSIILFVRQQGGDVLFYKMPLSSVQQKPLKTAQRLIDKETFLKMASIWRVPILQGSIETTDSDFPDLAHLAKRRSPEFSEQLALSLMQELSSRSSSGKK